MPHTQAMFDKIESLSSELREGLPPDPSFLYVGWRHDTKPWWHDRLAKELLGAKEIGVLEIHPRNCSDLETQVWAGRYSDVQVYLGDVRRYIGRKWDVIFWDHGPEHCPPEDLPGAIENLLFPCQRLLMLCGPWGEWPQGAEDGNEHEEHRTVLVPDLVRSLAFDNVVTTGKAGQPGEGEIFSWVRMK
jgi:hypothetical protein